MKIYKEGIDNYEPWSGAVDRWNEIVEAGKVDELENMLEDEFPEGMSETELNDFIWFEEDTWRDWLGMSEEEEEEEEEEEDLDEDEDEEEDGVDFFTWWDNIARL